MWASVLGGGLQSCLCFAVVSCTMCSRSLWATHCANFVLAHILKRAPWFALCIVILFAFWDSYNTYCSILLIFWIPEPNSVSLSTRTSCYSSDAQLPLAVWGWTGSTTFLVFGVVEGVSFYCTPLLDCHIGPYLRLWQTEFNSEIWIEPFTPAWRKRVISVLQELNIC